MGTGGSFPGGKAAGAWSWSLTSSKYQRQTNMDLYINSPICLHGVVLNSLSTRTALPYSYTNLSIQNNRAVIKFSTLMTVMDPPLPILRTNCNFNNNIFVSFRFWILPMMSIWIDELNAKQNLSNCMRETSSHQPQTVNALNLSS
jgi:hypothetical protein